MNKSHVRPLALALSLGIIWGISVFFIGILAAIFGYGAAFVEGLGSLYIGYKATFAGSVTGGVLGFLDAFIFGLILAWLYNLFASQHDKK